MERMRDCFDRFGLDYTTTMERFVNNEALYLRLLGKLFPNDELQKLAAALEAGDIASAFDAAHTLKGVVGNFGLTPLYKAVCQLAEPLRTGEARADYPALYQCVQVEFQRAETFWKTLLDCESTN